MENNNIDKVNSATGDNLANPLEEPSVTMLDVLEEEKELEEEYAAVLGASDEKSCTYTQGAVKRQALYSCLTCCPETRNDLDKSAGICLACSYHCHENHELVELYTKRNFRCDCPTERTGTNRCCLNSSLKQPEGKNTDNLYNQNFQGLYCACHRPYPDPERTTEEVMLQCIICEDWFHLQHLEGAPANAAKLVDACSEMICGSCMQQHQFLHNYTGLALKAVDNLDETMDASVVGGVGDVSVVGCDDNDDNKLKSDLDKSISDIMNMSEAGGSAENGGEPSAKRQKLNAADVEKDTVKPEEIKCRRPTQTTDYEKG